MKDLELHRMFFYTVYPPLGRAPQDSASVRGAQPPRPPRGFPVPKEYHETLKAALKRLNHDENTPIRERVFPSPSYLRLFTGQPNPASDWKELDKESCLKGHADSQVITDGLFVLLSLRFEREYAKEQIDQLWSHSKEVQGSGAQFLGEVRCWCIQEDTRILLETLRSEWNKLWKDTSHHQEAPNGTPPQEANADAAAQPEDYLFEVLRGKGDVHIRFAPDREDYLIVYREGSETEAGKILHLALPLIALQRMKIRNILNHYHSVYETASHIEQELEALMGQARMPQPLAQIEQLSLQITEKQQEFLEQVSILEKYKETLEIAYRNLEAVCEEFELRSVGSNGNVPAPARLVSERDVRFAIEQLQIHLSFLYSTRSQAELSLESLNTAASVRNAQWLRVITYIGAPFAAASIVEAFQEDLKALCNQLGFGGSAIALFVAKIVSLIILILIFCSAAKYLTKTADKAEHENKPKGSPEQQEVEAKS